MTLTLLESELKAAVKDELATDSLVEFLNHKSQELVRFLNILDEGNKRQNLTRITAEEGILLHLVDSLLIHRVADLHHHKKMLDLGSGGGVPAFPLKITYPHLAVTMVDTEMKKVQFLLEAIRSMELTETTAVHARAEELGKKESFREQFDLVTARALAPMEILVELALPFLAVDGELVCYKGSGLKEELTPEFLRLTTELGGTITKEIELVVPETDIIRTFLVLQKTSHTPEQFPRRTKKIYKR